jgi:hypothetical protein
MYEVLVMYINVRLVSGGSLLHRFIEYVDDTRLFVTKEDSRFKKYMTLCGIVDRYCFYR